jgi:HSP20 family protein
MEVRMTNGYAPNGLLFGGWNQLLNELDAGGERGFSPRTDVVEDAEGYHFHFEMPGLKADWVDVRIEDGALVVEAERKRPEWSKETTVRVSERAYGKLHRAFELPEDANHEGIRAAYKDGVLSVTVPKRPETKPVKVKIEFEN